MPILQEIIRKIQFEWLEQGKMRAVAETYAGEYPLSYRKYKISFEKNAWGSKDLLFNNILSVSNYKVRM